MTPKLMPVRSAVLHAFVVLIFFAMTSSQIMRFGKYYNDSIFPVNYSIIGGYYIRDWAPWFFGLGFILGWLPFNLIFVRTRQNSSFIPLVITIVGVLVLWLVSISSKGFWGDVARPIIMSGYLGMVMNSFRIALRQTSGA